MSDEYEIVPEQELNSLKHDIDNIKKDPIGNTRQGLDLKDSIDNLNSTINNLFNLFKTTADQINAEEHNSKMMNNQIGPLVEKIESLTKQNEKIAEGIVTLANMIDEIKGKKEPQQNVSQNNIERPSLFPNEPAFPSSNPQNPVNRYYSPSQSPGPSPLPMNDMPSIPPPMVPRKKGLFGR